MPASRLFDNKRRLFAMLALLSVLMLLVGLAPWPEDAWYRPLRRIVMGIGAGGLVASLMLWWSPGLCDTYPRSKFWRIQLESLPPLVLYMLAASRWPAMVDAMPNDGLRAAAALVPALLVLWGCMAFVRLLRMIDEMQQRLELMSVAYAAGLVGIVGAVAGFLHMAGVVEVRGELAIWIYPLLLLAYSLVRAGVTRRYQ